MFAETGRGTFDQHVMNLSCRERRNVSTLTSLVFTCMTFTHAARSCGSAFAAVRMRLAYVTDS